MVLIEYNFLIVECEACEKTIELPDSEPRKRAWQGGFTFNDDDTFTCDTCNKPATATYYDEEENDITEQIEGV